MNKKTKHILSLAMLCATAIIWGAGFLLNKMLLNNGFETIPFTLNAIRFCLAALVLGAVCCKKIHPNKQLFIYGSLGGLFLFGGFALQLFGLKYTTPAANSFFTAAYALFVPFFAWAISKNRPNKITLLGVAVALAGFAILNIPTGATEHGSNELLGNLLTVGAAVFMALQIVITDKALQDDRQNPYALTVVQLSACALLFVIAALATESKNYASVQINVIPSLWQIGIISLLGTAFAYFAQTYAQAHLSPTETSVIAACESPFGAIFSIIAGEDSFEWTLLVGGILIFVAVVIMEALPNRKKKAPSNEDANE